LVELLVVVSIIAVLVTLSAAAVVRYAGTQKQANTVALIKMLDEVRKRQWSIAVDAARQAKPPGYAGLVTIAGGNPDRARRILIKLYLAQAFPVTFVEALQPPSYGWGPPSLYAGTLGGVGINSGNATAIAATLPPGVESSILLLMALERNGILNREN